MEIDAEAVAEKHRREARGDADAIFFKMEAEAHGIQEILTKQADGFGRIVDASAKDPARAALMMIVDKLPEIVKTQVEAIKNVKIDKVTVRDSMGGGTNGKPSTASFLSGMIGSVPPLQDLFKMAGMDLPDYLGKQNPGGRPEQPLPSPQAPSCEIDTSSDSIVAVCPHCGKRYDVTTVVGDKALDAFLDAEEQQLKCRVCKKHFSIPLIKKS